MGFNTSNNHELFSPPPIAAVIEGGSLPEIYDKVKHTINEQSGQHVWLPSDEPI